MEVKTVSSYFSVCSFFSFHTFRLIAIENSSQSRSPQNNTSYNSKNWSFLRPIHNFSLLQHTLSYISTLYLTTALSLFTCRSSHLKTTSKFLYILILSICWQFIQRVFLLLLLFGCFLHHQNHHYQCHHHHHHHHHNILSDYNHYRIE